MRKSGNYVYYRISSYSTSAKFYYGMMGGPRLTAPRKILTTHQPTLTKGAQALQIFVATKKCVLGKLIIQVRDLEVSWNLHAYPCVAFAHLILSLFPRKVDVKGPRPRLGCYWEERKRKVFPDEGVIEITHLAP